MRSRGLRSARGPSGCWLLMRGEQVGRQRPWSLDSASLRTDLWERGSAEVRVLCVPLRFFLGKNVMWRRVRGLSWAPCRTFEARWYRTVGSSSRAACCPGGEFSPMQNSLEEPTIGKPMTVATRLHPPRRQTVGQSHVARGTSPPPPPPEHPGR